MRNTLLESIKTEISEKLAIYAASEGVVFRIAANDNNVAIQHGLLIEAIECTVLPATHLLYEIRVMLSLMGKKAVSESFLEGLYHCLHPHQLTLAELSVLLSCLHIEALSSPSHKHASMRYIVEKDCV